MRILLLIKSLGLGGAEKHVVECAKAFHNLGHDVRVLTLSPHDKTLFSDLENEGIECKCVGGKIWWLDSWLSLFRDIKRDTPEVLHAHLPIPALFARFLKLFFPYKLVFTEHNVFVRLHPLTKLAHAFTHFLDDETVSCSQEVSDSLMWKSSLVPNGIDIPDSLPSKTLRSEYHIPEDAVVFICVANLYPKKNHVQLIKAFKQASASFSDVESHLVLVGQDGSERQRIELLINENGLQDSVHLLGARADARYLNYESNVFCLTSLYEGLPIAMLEAMAAKLPLIVTDAGGMAGVLKEGKNGLLVDREDVQSTADAMVQLYSSKEARESMGLLGYELVKRKYSQDAMIMKMLGIYSKTV